MTRRFNTAQGIALATLAGMLAWSGLAYATFALVTL